MVQLFILTLCRIISYLLTKWQYLKNPGLASLIVYYCMCKQKLFIFFSNNLKHNDTKLRLGLKWHSFCQLTRNEHEYQGQQKIYCNHCAIIG